MIFPIVAPPVHPLFRHPPTELNLKGRTAPITGGSRGIGYGVAESLAAEGCVLHLASRNAESLAAARKKLAEKYGVSVTVRALDPGKSENMLKLAKAAGPLDIPINDPGAIETDRQVVRWKARAKKEFGDEGRWRELTTGFPCGRLRSVAAIADTVSFPCSDRSSYTTGTVVTIDGGNSLRK